MSIRIHKGIPRKKNRPGFSWRINTDWGLKESEPDHCRTDCDGYKICKRVGEDKPIDHN